MAPLKNPTEIVGDRVKLPFTFDVEQMQQEYKKLTLRNFIYYDVLQLRGPAHIIDPSLPIPPPADDYADGSWTDWLNSPTLNSSPYFTGIVDKFRELTDVTLVRLLRLEPGAVVKEHTDPTLGLQIEKSVIRLTIPIINEPGVEFILNGDLVPMVPGECWYLRLTDPHRVLNNSNKERVNMSIDMIPNDAIKAIIMESHEAMSA
ncbi:MAG: aspartyl/asparaginyl beta-hydroxylase domain-containing protein [Bacteroidota bacterium]